MIEFTFVMKYNCYIFWSVIGAFVFALTYTFTDRMPELFTYGKELMDLFFGIALSVIAAGVFYLLQVYLPEQRRRKVIKAYFKESYYDFKKQCIGIFLSIAEVRGSVDEDLLLQHEAFRAFFKEPVSHRQDRWGLVLNGMDGILLQLLRQELEVFEGEVQHFLSTINIYDLDAYNYLKRLKRLLFSLRNVSPDDYDGVKHMGRMFWDIFAKWSFIDGGRKGDIFEELYRRI